MIEWTVFFALMTSTPDTLALAMSQSEYEELSHILKMAANLPEMLPDTRSDRTIVMGPRGSTHVLPGNYPGQGTVYVWRTDRRRPGDTWRKQH